MSAPRSSSAKASAWRWALPLGFALFSVTLVGVYYKSFGTDPHAVPFMLEGKKAPPFTLRRMDTGEPVTLEQLKGKPVLLNFWATWCGPCRQEHPVLEWGFQRFGEQVQFVGVVFEDSEENARKFLTENGSSFPQLIDQTAGNPPREGTMAVDYGVAGVPESYFIDREGTIRGKVAYPIDPQTLTARLNDVLGPAASALSP